MVCFEEMDEIAFDCIDSELMPGMENFPCVHGI